MTDFVRLYADVILKKTVSKIAADQKKKTKAVQTTMQTAETGNDVRSGRHWKASANDEFYYREIETGFQRLRELDELTGWSDNLHQDRYKFMEMRYGDVLEEYLKEENK